MTGKRTEGDRSGDLDAVGGLTIGGVTRQVTRDLLSEGAGVDPWGNDRLVFSATTKIDRKDFGLVWNQLLETGGVAVGDTGGPWEAPVGKAVLSRIGGVFVTTVAIGPGLS